MTEMFARRGSHKDVESALVFTPKFDENGLIPAITQDAKSGEVVMFAFMNALALEKTILTGQVHYWSRSRNKLWLKGETSGEIQNVVEIKTDCDQDVILIRAELTGRGATCHTGKRACFYRSIDTQSAGSDQPVSLIDTGGERLFNHDDVYK